MKNITKLIVGGAVTVSATFAHAQMKADDLAAAQSLFANNGCAACHSASDAGVGPALKAIAKRYKGKKVVDELAGRIREGSSGRWGDAAHPPMGALEPDEAKLLARWIQDGAR